ncbi:hypothetical protein B0A69_04150 [Chryseobacterium shigense]|nr:hypothetical protein B0A69_04150 [Chryseobacterium shigense]
MKPISHPYSFLSLYFQKSRCIHERKDKTGPSDQGKLVFDNTILQALKSLSSQKEITWKDWSIVRTNFESH